MLADLVPAKRASAGRGVIDVERVRRETPGLLDWLHLDSAGASPTPDPVHRRMVAHLEREREIGGYAAAREAEAELENFYGDIAALIGAQPEEIAFAENATRAWDMLFYGLDLRPGDRILTTRAEYASNYLAFLQVAEKTGAVIECVPDGDDGTIDVAALAARLDARVKLVSLCHAPTSNGLLADAEAVGRVLEGHPAFYLLDACQSVGQVALDVERIGCDGLSATGRKFLRGPRGTGFLYVRAGALEQVTPPFIDMRAATCVGPDRYRLSSGARRFESWESAVAGRLGLAAAARYALSLGLEAIETRIQALARGLRSRLAAIPAITVADRGTRRTGIVTFRTEGWPAERLRDALALDRIGVSAIDVEDAWLDFGREDAGVVRASVHYFNTEADLDRFVEVLSRVLKGGA